MNLKQILGCSNPGHRRQYAPRWHDQPVRSRSRTALKTQSWQRPTSSNLTTFDQGLLRSPPSALRSRPATRWSGVGLFVRWAAGPARSTSTELSFYVDTFTVTVSQPPFECARIIDARITCTFNGTGYVHESSGFSRQQIGLGSRSWGLHDSDGDSKAHELGDVVRHDEHDERCYAAGPEPPRWCLSARSRGSGWARRAAERHSSNEPCPRGGVFFGRQRLLRPRRASTSSEGVVLPRDLQSSKTCAWSRDRGAHANSRLMRCVVCVECGLGGDSCEGYHPDLGRGMVTVRGFGG